MSESVLLEAVVEAVSKAKTGIKIGEDWYNVNSPDTQNPEGGVIRGSTVKFKWSMGKNDRGQEGRQIRTKIVVVKAAPKWDGNKSGGKGGWKGGGGGFKKDPETQASIEKQACLKAACELVAATLTGKSNPTEAAELVLKITKEILIPYVANKAATAPSTAKSEGPKAEALEDLDEAPEGAEGGLEDLDDEDTPF